MADTALMMRARGPEATFDAEQVRVGPAARGQVRVAVAASGVCYADLATSRSGSRDRPVTPGHEVAGVIAEVGPDAGEWQVGDRVAVGWFGGSCGQCSYCRRGDVVHCPDRKVPGLSYPGGWAESVTVPAEALARIPEGLGFIDAAPMGCAGVTTYNALRHASLAPGSRVAVFGVGGLGHLAVQFAAKMGHEVVAIARGAGRETLARQLGAGHYIDSEAEPAGAALHRLGGADLILSTSSTTTAVPELLTGLRVRGTLTVVGVDSGHLDISVARLVMNSQVIKGHLTGSAHDTEEAMRFALHHDVKPIVETMPLARASEAVARLRGGQARFRIVLEGSWRG
ncbi:alcohol dehydrogenase catalytic domain-containing protein [Paenarthrobacter sp. NPDC090520]|uniref:alcohol dehydrogenase catalytic domain-containing protein n=1 Tax=unclassified Paenarthrobacter TaxID=2634190 RepID=UPI00380E51E1